MFILTAYLTNDPIHFIEIFSSKELITKFLANHPNIIQVSITYHEINPD